MHCDPAKSWLYRQRSPSGFRSLRTSSRCRSQQCPRPGLSALKFWLPVALGLSADPKGDLKRGDELVSQGLALDPNSAGLHTGKGNILRLQARFDEAIAENERALALDPSNADANRGPGL